MGLDDRSDEVIGAGMVRGCSAGVGFRGLTLGYPSALYRQLQSILSSLGVLTIDIVHINTSMAGTSNDAYMPTELMFRPVHTAVLLITIDIRFLCAKPEHDPAGGR